jgi:hypothetical protein
MNTIDSRYRARWMAVIATCQTACAVDSMIEVAVVVERSGNVQAQFVSVLVTDAEDSTVDLFNISAARWNDEGTYVLALTPRDVSSPGRCRVEVTAVQDGEMVKSCGSEI